MTIPNFSSERTVQNMFSLLQEQIIDDFAHDNWKTATPLTAIDEEG